MNHPPLEDLQVNLSHSLMPGWGKYLSGLIFARRYDVIGAVPGAEIRKVRVGPEGAAAVLGRIHMLRQVTRQATAGIWGWQVDGTVPGGAHESDSLTSLDDWKEKGKSLLSRVICLTATLLTYRAKNRQPSPPCIR